MYRVQNEPCNDFLDFNYCIDVIKERETMNFEREREIKKTRERGNKSKRKIEKEGFK